MATAAVTDAFYKDRRRSDLDLQIAETKTKLARLMEHTMASDLARLYESSPKYYDAFVDLSPPEDDPLHMFASYSRLRLAQKPTWEVPREKLKLRTTRKRIFFPKWGDNWVARSQSLALCSQAITAEEDLILLREREPSTDKQFLKATEMVNNLVDELLRVAYDETEAEAPGMHPGLRSPESAYNMIRMLRSDGYPSYQHPNIDPEKTARVRARVNELNKENMAAFAQWCLRREQSPRNREHYVAKICYNLLVSDVPPGIRNYNSLILGFTELNEHNLARAVVDSFLFKSQLKPTRATMLCLLQHYRLKQDIFGFQNIMKRLLGYDDRGIGIRRKSMHQIQLGTPGLTRWVRKPKVAINGDYAVELPRLDWAFYEVMIEGFLDFSFVQEALDLFLICLRNNFIPRGGLVNKVFHACIESVDPTITHTAVNGLISNIEQTVSMLFERRLGDFTSQVSRKIRRLLSLRSAQLIDIGSGDLWAVTKLDDPLSIDPVSQLVTTTYISCLEGEVEYWTKLLTRIQEKVFNPDPELGRPRPFLQRLDLAIEVIDKALERPKFYARENDHYQRMGKIEWLRKQCNASAENVSQLEEMIYGITQPKPEQDPQADGSLLEKALLDERLELDKLSVEGRETIEDLKDDRFPFWERDLDERPHDDLPIHETGVEKSGANTARPGFFSSQRYKKSRAGEKSFGYQDGVYN